MVSAGIQPYHTRSSRFHSKARRSSVSAAVILSVTGCRLSQRRVLTSGNKVPISSRQFSVHEARSKSLAAKARKYEQQPNKANLGRPPTVPPQSLS